MSAISPFSSLPLLVFVWSYHPSLLTPTPGSVTVSAKQITATKSHFQVTQDLECRDIPRLRKELRAVYRKCFDISYLSRKEPPAPTTLFAWLASIKRDFTSDSQPQEMRGFSETKMKQESVIESKLLAWQSQGSELASDHIARINELIRVYELEMPLLDIQEEMDRAVFEQLFEVEE
ncbi:UNVERIFIED_CONTAM: hypothetical protein HDU68_010387 [Siphonaria sp. JEL0065]|nr:hypothetical protein HDU68_010387 [Siphonaria sp. JEL0065]